MFETASSSLLIELTLYLQVRQREMLSLLLESRFFTSIPGEARRLTIECRTQRGTVEDI